MKEGRQTKKELFFEIVRFLIVGGLATLADYAVFFLFRQILLPAELFSVGFWNTLSLVIATGLGFLTGLFINWILSVAFVFRAVKDKEKAKSKRAFFTFALIGVIGLVLTEVGVVLLVYLLPEITLFGRTALWLPWREWIAKIVMTCIVLAFNYAGRKLFVFKS